MGNIISFVQIQLPEMQMSCCETLSHILLFQSNIVSKSINQPIRPMTGLAGVIIPSQYSKPKLWVNLTVDIFYYLI